MAALNSLEFFNVNGSIFKLLPFFAKSVIKFKGFSKFSFNPFSLVFSTNNENTFIDFVSYITNKNNYSYQFAIIDRKVISVNENFLLESHKKYLTNLNIFILNIYQYIIYIKLLLVNVYEKVIYILFNLK